MSWHDCFQVQTLGIEGDVYKAYRESCEKPFAGPDRAKVLQIMSLESVLVGAEDFKFENEKKLAFDTSEFTRPLWPAPHLCFRLATLATTSTTTPILKPSCQRSVVLWVM